jgi:predicted MFS family arabinose efflux permease
VTRRGWTKRQMLLGTGWLMLASGFLLIAAEDYGMALIAEAYAAVLFGAVWFGEDR